MPNQPPEAMPQRMRAWWSPLMKWVSHGSNHIASRFWSVASRRWLLDPASVFFGSLAVLMIALGAVLVTSVVSVGRINASSKHTFVQTRFGVGYKLEAEPK